jgi:hypothetical protein
MRRFVRSADTRCVRENRSTEYLAECLWPGVTESQLAVLDVRARELATATVGSSEGVRYLGSMLMPDDEVVFFVFTGSSAAAVEALAERAAIPFERIVESVRVAGPTEGDCT